MSGDPWFVRNQFWFRWFPYSWQGWLITLIALAGVVSVAVVSRLNRAWFGYLGVVAIVIAYISIAQATGRPASQMPSQSGGGSPDGSPPDSRYGPN